MNWFSNLLTSKPIINIILDSPYIIDNDELNSNNLSKLDTNQRNIKSNNTLSTAVYSQHDYVQGSVSIEVKNNHTIQHTGIIIECIGKITTYNNNNTNSNNEYIFSSEKKLLHPADILLVNRTYKFCFKNINMEYDTYYGHNIQLTYTIHVYIQNKNTIIAEKYTDYIVENANQQTITQHIKHNNNTKYEIGIEDCLHLEFTIDKTIYNINDVIVGNVQFLLNKIVIQTMELQLLRKEIIKLSTSNNQQLIDTYNISKYEIMYGSPHKGDRIPIRYYMNNLLHNVSIYNEQFDVKYYINIVIIDIDQRRYFKQIEIGIYRDKITHRHNPDYVKQ